MTMKRVEVLSSPERRRRWSRAEKERLVAAMLEPDANASDIARRAGVHTSQLFRWRQQFAGPQATEAFVPLQIAPPDESGAHAPEAPAMTIVFSNGAHIEFRSAPAPAVIAQIVELLGAAGGR